MSLSTDGVDATHAYTNPDATQNGKEFNMPIGYNEKADMANWADRKGFLARVL
ncbi:MAG: hypothetical protein IPN67_12450 [Bacteroidales bacterium]|nr:hypothetical protein [Bacteroidales bacterium]MBK8883154.1 hypothetical protein [Bacteroidales bacterium]